MNYYEDKPRYWRSCALWTEEDVKFLLSGIWPDEGESAPNSLGLTLIDVPKVETLCSTNESGIQEWLEIHETETVLVCPVPSDVTLSQLIEDAVSAGLLTPVPFAGQVRYARHLVNKFRPDDVIRWANKLGCFPDFPFRTDSLAAEPTVPPAPQARPVEQAGPDEDLTPDAERRLARLRELGGSTKYKNREWKFTGISALVEREKSEGRKRSDQKTIRADLKEAAQNELDARSAGAFSGLGAR